ncbi:MAG: endonuclease/exonuclease/phosphatase family protein [Bacteroidetes bacterium]|nr:endonuclease/exonuclease/phosphatase family protein [Bacteroidota bacterium]
MSTQEQKIAQEEKKKRKGKRYYFNRIAMFANHVVAIALLTSYLAPYVSPENFWLFSFFGLGYPVLVILNLLFVLYWSIQLKKRLAYSLLIIICGWPQLHSFIQISFKDTPDKSKEILKVMSYNVKVFDLYNWSHNTETRTKMFELIQDENPEIMCFQEFFTRDSSKQNNMDSLLKFKNAKYVHSEYSVNDKHKQHFGIATFSKYPIVNKGKINFGYKGNNVCIYTDVLWDKDTIRIYNMHLQSIAFSKEDYKYADDLKKDVETEDVERSKNILRRLKRAFVKRAKQADLIAASIESCKYPVIVCGDFNDTPASYAYKTILGDLSDSFIESGSGLGRSYIGKFPSFRIDYILHSDHFRSYEFRTIREELSDHFPIITYLEVQ